MWPNIGNKILNNLPLGSHMNQIQLYCKTEVWPLIHHIIPEYPRSCNPVHQTYQHETKALIVALIWMATRTLNDHRTNIPE